MVVPVMLDDVVAVSEMLSNSCRICPEALNTGREDNERPRVCRAGDFKVLNKALGTLR